MVSSRSSKKFRKQASALSLFLMFVMSPVHGADSPAFLRDGVASFVVSHIEYVLAPDAIVTGGCSAGLNESYQSNTIETFFDVPAGAAGLDKPLENQYRELQAFVTAQPAVQSYCESPETAVNQAHFSTVVSNNFKLPGMNLDQTVSASDSQSAPNSCAHQDFTAGNGDEGVDNQYARVVGCIPGYQSSGQANSFNTSQLTGAWGLLIKLEGVDDLINDDQVTVSLFANGDPIRLSAQREPLEYATYTKHAESRFWASSQGKIIDGVLHAGSMEVRFPYDVNAMYVERVLLDARLQLTINSEGRLDGYLGGFAPVEDQYDLEYAFRNARKNSAKGSEMSPRQRRVATSFGKASVVGYTCEGVYSALYEHADGHYDPQRDRCTSISTQYQITAIPAFIIGD